MSPKRRPAPDEPDDLFTDAEWRALATAWDLSAREREVARLLCAGHSRPEIASHLRKRDGESLSRDTVRVYVDRIFRKVGVSNRMTLLTAFFREFRRQN